MPAPRYYHEREEDDSGSHPLRIDVPLAVRVKVVPVLRSLLPATANAYDDPHWNELNERIRIALGKRELPNTRTRGGLVRPLNRWQWFLEDAPYQELLTSVEATLEHARQFATAQQIQAAVEDINELLGAEHTAFRFIDTDQRPRWRVIRIESELVYEQTIARPLGALAAAGFKVAEDQFVDALLKRSEGDYAGAMTDANSALESVAKRILHTEKGPRSRLAQGIGQSGGIFLVHFKTNWARLATFSRRCR